MGKGAIVAGGIVLAVALLSLRNKSNSPIDSALNFDFNSDLFTLDWSPIYGNTGMTDTSQPRGVRNNNPLNIRWFGGGKWQGMTGIDETNHVIFESLYWGLRAAALDLKNKRKRGLDSIAEIIPIWAPAADGAPVENYIKFVEAQTGFGRYQTLWPADYLKLIRAMSYFENGKDFITDRQIEQGMQAGGLYS